MHRKKDPEAKAKHWGKSLTQQQKKTTPRCQRSPDQRKETHKVDQLSLNPQPLMNDMQNKVLWSTSWGKPKGEPNQEIYRLQDFIGLRSRDLSGVLECVAALLKLRWPQNTHSEWNLLTFQWNECSKIEFGKHWCKSVATKGGNKFKRVWMVII